MAYATQLTISTGNKVSINYQTQEVSVSLTYQLEREDADVLQVVQEKAAEVAMAHQMAWQRIRDAKVRATRAENVEPADVSSLEDEACTQNEAVQDDPATVGQQAALRAILAHLGWSEEHVRDYLMTHFFGDSNQCISIEQLTQRQASQWLLALQRNEREKAQQRRHSAVPLNGTTNPS